MSEKDFARLLLIKQKSINASLKAIEQASKKFDEAFERIMKGLK